MPDLWFYGILNFLKKGRASSKFRKIRAIILKLHTNTLHPSRNFGIGQNRSKCSNFFRFWIFWEFSQNCLTQANFDLSSWNFVRKCTNTEWCLILSFVKIGGDFWILNEFEFLNFFTVTSNFKIRCIHEASFVRKLKSSNVYFLTKRTMWNRWGSNMGISIHILFFLSLWENFSSWFHCERFRCYMWNH